MNTEKRNFILFIVGLSAYFIAILAIAFSGNAPGEVSGHPRGYLTTSFTVCWIVTMIMPVLGLKRILSLPWWFIGLETANIIYYSASLFMGFYLDISWWGNVAHAISSMAVGTVVFIALCVVSCHSPSHVSLGGKWGILALTLIITVSFGGIWEIMEGYTDIILGHDYMVYGAWDTLLDLRADTGGALLITMIGWLVLRFHTPEQVSSSIRLRRRRKD